MADPLLSAENDIRLRLHNAGVADWVKRANKGEMLSVAQTCVDALDAMDRQQSIIDGLRRELQAVAGIGGKALAELNAACKHEHGSGILDTNGDGEFTCHQCGHVQKLGRGLRV